MSTLRLTNTDTVVVDLPARVSWALAITASAGECSFLVPRSSPAFAAAYINRKGGSLVEVLDSGYGAWQGLILSAPEFTDDGIQVTAHQRHVVLGTRYLPDGVTYTNVGAGWLFREIYRHTWAGAGPFSLAASISEGGLPLVESFAFSRQDAWSAWIDLMLMTDGELVVDPDTQALSWSHALGYANAYDGDLIQGANFHAVRVSPDPSQRVSEVLIDAAGAVTYAARDGGVLADGLPMQALMQADGTGPGRIAAAERELARRAEPIVTISGQVGSADAAIREGDIIERVVVHEFSTQTYPCRVLARALDDTTGRVDLVLEVLGTTADTFSPRPVGVVGGGSVGSEGEVTTGRPEPDLIKTILRLERERTRG